MLVENKRGNYSFLKGIAPYSAGVVAEAGFERLICFSGNRAGLDDAKGLDNCEAGLKRIVLA